MDGTARLWQIESGEMEREFQHIAPKETKETGARHGGGGNGGNGGNGTDNVMGVSVNSVAIADMDTNSDNLNHFNNGNHYIVTGSADTTARVWERLRGR